MNRFLKALIVSAIILTIVLSAGACSKTPENAISQADYDALKAQLSAAQAKISELQATTTEPVVSLNEQVLKDQITTLQAQIDKLGSDIKNLNDQNVALSKEKADLQAQYTDLNTKYVNLQKTIASTTTTTTTTTPPAEQLTVESVENEILRLINVDRVKAGVPEFIFGKNMYTLARLNSANMARTGKFEYDTSVYYQEVFWGINYTTLKSLTEAAIKTWSLNIYRWQSGGLLDTNKYGAVGAYYQDGVFFITFMAAIYP